MPSFSFSERTFLRSVSDFVFMLCLLRKKKNMIEIKYKNNKKIIMMKKN